MSFRHRRNFSLANTTKSRPKSPSQTLSRSLRKIAIPNNYYWLLAAAKQHYYKSNDMPAAITSFEDYLAHYPTNLEALYLCGISYMQTHQYQQAIQKLTDYLSLRKVSPSTNRKLIINATLPQNSKAFLLLSIAYSKLNMLTKSLETINEALSFETHFQQGYCFRAKLYLKLQQPQKAFYDFRQAIKLNSKCIAAQVGLADYHSAGNNFTGALRHYETARSWLLPAMQEQTKKDKKITEQNMDQLKTLAEIDLKIGICLYHLGENTKSIDLLKKCLISKNNRSLSEIYYYLALNQLKEHNGGQHLYSSGKGKHEGMKEEDNFLRQAFLNLQCSIKSNSNPKIMGKACKMLIKILIKNNQFYETANVLQLADHYHIEIRKFRDLCDSCMLVIKQKHEKAIPILKKLYEEITNKEKKQRSAEKQQQNKQESGRMKSSVKKIKLSRHSQPSNTNSIFSKRLRTSVDDSGFENLMTAAQKKQTKLEEDLEEIEWMKPTVLLFRAYAEYFSDSFIECLQTYELYENYLKDYMGKEPENDIYLSYNKVLCQGLLMLENQMTEECLQKFNLAIDNYYKFTRNIPTEPVLFRIIALLRIALSEDPILSIQLNSRVKIMGSILDLIDHYMPAVKKNSMIFYYMGIVFYDLGRYKEASDAVEHCLKIAEQCTWKFLYVKGVIQMKRKMFKQAIREFAAGNLVEERADFYLGRCLCYIGLFDQSGQEEQAYIQKSFQDLQKFIQLQNDKQKISKWVTKILFFNKAYEEVSKSIKKVPVDVLETNEEIIQIAKCLCIYKGQFEEGGVIGGVIMNAFDGKYEEGFIMIQDQKHQIVFEDFFRPKYTKWLTILNMYSQENYNDLIKFLQIAIFEEKNNEQLLELRYNLAIVYYLIGEASKGDNVMGGLPKYSVDVTDLVSKFVDRNLSPDECVNDLQESIKGGKKLSAYLPYRKIALPSKEFLGNQLSVFVKISVPFPQFPKPDIILELGQDFLVGESFQSCIPKKIQAPWIKKVTGQIQFTDNMIESEDTSFMNLEEEEKELSVSSDLLQHSRLDSGDDDL